MTQDAILDKVRKLLRLAGNNPNAEEAASAAAHAQRLIDAHRLSDALLAVDGAPPEPDEPITDFAEPMVGASARQARWRITLASGIARANACRIYLQGGAVKLVGRASDAERARYLYAWLARETERLANANGRGNGHVWRNNFRLGVVDTVTRRLREQRATMEREAREQAAAAATPGALVRVDQALARMDARSASVRVWMDTNMRLVKSRATSGGRYDSGARAAGQRAGESISLGGSRAGLTSGARRLHA